MMNCFCGMLERRKVFNLISSRDYCQRSSPSPIFNTPRVGLEPAQNLSSDLVEWSCAVVITTAPWRHGGCFAAANKELKERVSHLEEEKIKEATSLQK